MPTSSNFDLIRTFIDPNQRRTFTASGYIIDSVNDNEARTMFPHVL